jgi:hypothetical protein
VSVTVIKVLVILMLLVIVGSLFSALVFLFRDRGGTRTARALTVRISLSITLFVLLMAGFYFGIIPPVGLR